MASRSDRELARGLEPFIRDRQAMRQTAARRLGSAIGITATDKMEILLELHQAALRGLAMELMFARDGRQVASAQKLLGCFERLYVEHLLAAQQDGSEPVSPT